MNNNQLKAFYLLEPWPKLAQTLSQELPTISFYEPSSYDEETILMECPEDVDFLIGYQVSKELLEKLSNLKAILLPWTGTDSFDFELLRQYPDIQLVNSHGNARTVAEFALTLLLAAAKRIPFYHKKMEQGKAMKIRFKFRSVDISNKTALLLGTGAIGIEIARILKHGFNVTCLGIKNNPQEQTPVQKQLFSEIQGTEDLLANVKKVDFVISSLPLTDETSELMNQEFFAAMSNHTIFVNVGRGKTIEEGALYKALQDKKIFAAGIDPVWQYPKHIEQQAEADFYPWEIDHPFQNLDNVVLSPHRAAITHDNDDFLDDVVRDLQRLCKGKEPINKVNLQKEY